MIVKIPQGIRHNAKHLVDVAGPASAVSVPGLEHPPFRPHPPPLDPPSPSLVVSSSLPLTSLTPCAPPLTSLVSLIPVQMLC